MNDKKYNRTIADDYLFYSNLATLHKNWYNQTKSQLNRHAYKYYVFQAHSMLQERC